VADAASPPVLVCGIDEAGRGPLAGPVCAAAVILPDGFPRELLDDSKKLSASRRTALRHIICRHALAWGTGWASHQEIDEINILRASLLAMRRAFAVLYPLPSEEAARVPETARRAAAGIPDNDAGVWPEGRISEASFGRPLSPLPPPSGITAIIDGLHTPGLPVSCIPRVKADAEVPEVMAASILAKTARDELMETYGHLYPQYGYERHKGYPTKEHRELVLRYGPSPIQRMSFAVKGIGEAKP
jgi:ribonuclease HII